MKCAFIQLSLYFKSIDTYKIDNIIIRIIINRKQMKSNIMSISGKRSFIQIYPKINIWNKWIVKAINSSC